VTAVRPTPTPGLAERVRHGPRHTPRNGTPCQPVTQHLRGAMHADPHLDPDGYCCCTCPKCRDKPWRCICPDCVAPSGQVTVVQP
jgi:hypothetical protein